MFVNDEIKFNPEDVWVDSDNDIKTENGDLTGEKGGESTQTERGMDDQSSGKVDNDLNPDSEVKTPSAETDYSDFGEDHV